MDINKVAEEIGIPVEDWVAQCYGIACECVKAGVVDGHPVYGHFLGYIEDGSPWDERCGNKTLVVHGWVLMPDGTIFDPTRWQFEANGPYIYVGDDADYDEGGNRFREQMHIVKPLPSYSKDEMHKEVDFGNATEFVEGVLCHSGPTGQHSMSQLFYIANMPYNALGEWAGDVYVALYESNLGALIPIDNQRMAEREFGVEC